MLSEALTVYVIFYNPSDYPGKYVLRPQHVVGGDIIRGDVLPVEDSLHACQARLPLGLYRLDRLPGELPTVAECWL